MIRIENPRQLMDLEAGVCIDRKNLYEVIQFSKVPDSPFWSGVNWVIGNTPQQGINWIGLYPNIKGVLIKVRDGKYQEDGWLGNSKNIYRYSFKANKGEVNWREKANMVLIEQPEKRYPILLLSDYDGSWFLEGRFNVINIGNRTVNIERV